MTVECNAQSGPSRIRSRTFSDTFTSRQGHQEIPHTVHSGPHRHIDVSLTDIVARLCWSSSELAGRGHGIARGETPLIGCQAALRFGTGTAERLAGLLATDGTLTSGARSAEDWPLDNRVSATVRLQAAGTPQALLPCLLEESARFPGAGDEAFRRALHAWARAPWEYKGGGAGFPAFD